jgi:hypothetical protein
LFRVLVFGLWSLVFDTAFGFRDDQRSESKDQRP